MSLVPSDPDVGIHFHGSAENISLFKLSDFDENAVTPTIQSKGLGDPSCLFAQVPAILG